MTIEITEFANVDISISPTGVALGNFGILGFLTKEQGILPTERGRAYRSIKEVSADWPTSSEVYKAAATFYGQSPTPLDFTVLTNYINPQPAYLLGGGSLDLAGLEQVSSGSFIIDVPVDGPTTVTFDLTGITSYDDAASKIDVALTAATTGYTCTHNGTSFVIKSNSVGSTATVSFLSGISAEALGFEQHQATISLGLDSETPVESLAKAVDKNITFIGLVLHKDMRDQVAEDPGYNTEDVADWCEANKKIFMNITNNLSSVSSAVTTDIGSLLKLKGLRFTDTSFAKNRHQYIGASVFGRMASVNFEGIKSTITVNLKQMPSVSAEDLTSGELAVLRNKNVNVLIVIGSDAIGFTDSAMSNGSWLDTTHGLLWLENRIEVDMFNLLYRSQTKIPYTQTGLNTVISVLDRSLQAAVRNGLAAPGFLTDGTYLPNGYDIASVKLVDVATADKSGRLYRGLSFRMVGAGALHKINTTGQFSE